MSMLQTKELKKKPFMKGDNLSDKEFKLWVIRCQQDLGKIDEHREF